MISRDSSGLVVKDLGVQYGGPWFERWSVTFFNIFYHVVTVLLEYFDSTIYSCLVFAL